MILFPLQAPAALLVPPVASSPSTPSRFPLYEERQQEEQASSPQKVRPVHTRRSAQLPRHSRSIFFARHSTVDLRFNALVVSPPLPMFHHPPISLEAIQLLSSRLRPSALALWITPSRPASPVTGPELDSPTPPVSQTSQPAPDTLDFRRSSSPPPPSPSAPIAAAVSPLSQTTPSTPLSSQPHAALTALSHSQPAPPVVPNSQPPAVIRSSTSAPAPVAATAPSSSLAVPSRG